MIDLIKICIDATELLFLRNTINTACMKSLFRTILATATMFASWFSASSQLLYKVEGNGLEKPSYIFGTHHLAPLSVFNNIPNAPKAFNDCEAVIGEIDMTSDQAAMASAMMTYMTAPSDSTISTLLSKEEFTKASEEFRKWAPIAGMELQMLDQLRPMAVTAMIATEIMKQHLPQYDPTQQLDSYFETESKKAGKTFIALETPEMQARLLFTTIPLLQQARSLYKLLTDPSEEIETATKLNEAYFSHNIDKLYEISQAENNDPEFNKAIIDTRNADWISRLPDIMADKPSFIAVGALHLVGPSGLIEGLRKKGFRITSAE